MSSLAGLFLVLSAFAGGAAALCGVWMGAWLVWRCLKVNLPLVPPKVDLNENAPEDDYDDDEEEEERPQLDEVL